MFVQEILTEATLHGLKPNEQQYFTKAVEFLRAELSIPASVKIDIAFNPKMHLDAGQSGLTIPNPSSKNHIFIFIAPGLSNGERVMTVAHEFIHVEHLVTGRMTIELKDGKYAVTWEDEPVEELKYSRSNPWEVDAHSRDNQLGRKLISKIGNLT